MTMNRDERLALADRYEAGLRKMEAAGYEEFADAILEHKVVIAALRESATQSPPKSIADQLPSDLPADVIAAVVGGGITVDQVRKVWGLIRAALQLREWRGSALSRDASGGAA